MRFRHAILCLLVLAGSAQWVTSSGTRKASGEWVLTWSDEFNQPDGSAPDPGKWKVESGGKWANQELQAYTARPENLHVRKGKLEMIARRERYSGADGLTRDYTSARLNTLGKFDQAYGRFEARIRIPSGQGIWPAFWLMGNDIHAVNWPNCGEIDIMENIGREPKIVHWTIHGPGYSNSKGISAGYTIAGKRVADRFHVFAAEWEPQQIRFYADGDLYATRTPADLPAGTKWVFDHPFFVILDLAVGGEWPGNPEATTRFPQTMLVDYVRVYTRASQ